MGDFDVAGLLQTVTDLTAAWGLKVLGALLVLFIGRSAARWARRVTQAALRRGNTDPTLVPFISSLVYYLLLVFVAVAVLGMVGIQTASIIAVLGAAGLAVGFALQGTLSNLAAGVMLLIFRPFKNGDFIEAAGASGSVQAIGIFTTLLKTPDNIAIIVPNANVWGDTIKNYAVNDTRRIDLVMGIGYGDDIQRAIDTIRDVLNADERVLRDPEAVVAVNELADSSVNLVVRPWCKRENYGALRWDLIRALKEQLEAAGCNIPFPQRDVHLHQASTSAA